jgi:hypothetical protein
MSERRLLEALFSKLNEAAVRYAVLRNHVSLPFATAGSDVDILIAPDDAHRTLALIFSAIEYAGGTPIGVMFSFAFIKVNVIWKDKANHDWGGLSIDVYVGVFFRGAQLLRMLDSSTPLASHDGIRVMPDGVGSVLAVLKEVLNNGRVPSRYVAIARDAAAHDWPSIERELHPTGQQFLVEFRSLLLGSIETRTYDEKHVRCDIGLRFMLFHESHIPMSSVAALMNGLGVLAT